VGFGDEERGNCWPPTLRMAVLIFFGPSPSTPRSPEIQAINAVSPAQCGVVNQCNGRETGARLTNRNLFVPFFSCYLNPLAALFCVTIRSEIVMMYLS